MSDDLLLPLDVPTPAGVPPLVVGLDDERALDPSLVGAKAANLARAAAAGMHVVPGEVLTTTATGAMGAAGASIVVGGAPEAASVVPDERVLELLDGMWRVADHGRHQLAVRSSSTVEDLGASSMAGRFTSVIGVASRDEFVAAVHTVLASAAGAALADGVAARPMAVLVQRVIHPVCGGVMFGIDPISGDRRHIVVEVSRLGPEAVVGGGVSRRARNADPSRPDHRRRRAGGGAAAPAAPTSTRAAGIENDSAVRASPGRRVGRRRRWLTLAAPDATGHRRRRPGERKRSAARSRPVRGDVPATAPAAGARSLARAGE